jgi:predicted DNA-binding transcriptional regulator AlpA
MVDEITDRCLTAEKAGRLLDLKVSTIWRLTYERRLPCVRVTGRRTVRYRLHDLEALLLMRRQPARAAGVKEEGRWARRRRANVSRTRCCAGIDLSLSAKLTLDLSTLRFLLRVVIVIGAALELLQ